MNRGQLIDFLLLTDLFQCSANCGRGEKIRKVTCKSLDGGTAPDNQCEGIKPENKAMCDMGSCAQGWFHTRWSEAVSCLHYLAFHFLDFFLIQE